MIFCASVTETAASFSDSVLHLTDDDGGASGAVVTVMAAAPTAELKFQVWAGPGPGSGVLGSVALAGLGPENQGRRNQ